MKKALTTAALLAFALVANTAVANEYSFDVNSKFINIAFESRMDIEDILGTSHSLEGSASFNGKSGSFDLKVPVTSLKTGVDMRDQHLQSEYWLDAAKNPYISFQGTAVVDKGNGKYEVTGDFSMHGVTTKKTIVVEVKEIAADKAKKFGIGDKGAIRIRSEFTVKLSDHKVTVPDVAAGKVNDVWTVKISLFAKVK